jgi:hypothetical protein
MAPPAPIVYPAPQPLPPPRTPGPPPPANRRGVVLVAAGSLLLAAGAGLAGAALGSHTFTPEPRQRVIVVPIGLGATVAGSALLIVGAERLHRWLYWARR